MSRWIDANKLIEFINSKFVVSWKHDYDGGFKDACVEILNAIEDAPTIEIIRCGECNLSGTEDCPMDEIDDEYFCNFGEREGE